MGPFASGCADRNRQEEFSRFPPTTHLRLRKCRCWLRNFPFGGILAMDYIFQSGLLSAILRRRVFLFMQVMKIKF